MAKLTAADRKQLPKSDYAVPPDHYPIEDADHARMALSMVMQHGSPEQIAMVRRAVAEKYPNIHVQHTDR